MGGEPSNAVFISYRRDVGGILAMALYQYLADHSVDAFYDIEGIGAGQFDTIILNQIAARPYFVPVLTPGTLDRCSQPGDWVCREIEHAFATKRMIVPVHTPNFDFGDLERFLPESLGHELGRFNAVPLEQRWFKAAVEELVDGFLRPIEIELTEAPSTDRQVVDRIVEQADAAPSVTAEQLSAQESAESAFAREADDFDGKIADYSEAIRLDPDYAGAYLNRADARYAKGDLDGAIADCNEAIRISPNDSGAFNNRGNARYGNGDLDGAIADYNEAIRLNPDDAIAFYNRGNARYANGDLDGAIADYNEAIRLNPDYALAFYNRGNARTDKGHLRRAIADYNEAIRINPDDPEAFHNRGNARNQRRDAKGAIADFDEAIRLDPTFALAFVNRGISRSNKGDIEGAIKDIEDGAALAPNNPDFPKLLAELRAKR